MKTSVVLPFALYPLLCSPIFAQAPDEWSVVSNSHFEIYSQASDRSSNQALAWFEKLRSVFLQGGFLPEIARPSKLPILRVIGFRSQQEYAQFRLRSAADAYYVGKDQQQYIVMPSLDARQFPIAAHEYAHFALHASDVKVPDWLGEGLAEYFSTLHFTANGYELGGDLPAHLHTLRREKWIPLSELLNVKLTSNERESRAELDLFYAQSWALADLMMTSAEYRSRLADFIATLKSQSGPRAFAQIYKKSLDEVALDLAGWLTRKRAIAGIAATLSPYPAASSSILSKNQSAALLADLLVTTGRLDRAREQYAQIALKNPHDPQIHAALGAIAFDKGDRMEALLQWRQALANGLKDADVCFRYAVTADDAGAPQSTVEAALVRAIELRPNFDDARFKLALLESNIGNYSEAIHHLHAMQAPHGPRAYGYWSALSYALAELDQRDDAVAAARKALGEATTDSEREHARNLEYVAKTDLKTQFTRDADGHLQMTTIRVDHGTSDWNPFIEPSDEMHSSNGQLTEVLCLAGKLTGFRVLTTNGSIALDVPDPLHVLVENGPGEFYCGATKKSAVRVDYAAKTTNILRGMKFNN